MVWICCPFIRWNSLYIFIYLYLLWFLSSISEENRNLLIYIFPQHRTAWVCQGLNQGWGQFHFFNSIPIPIPLFSIPIPIPIPLFIISFNSNSNSNSGDFNSNSNSGDFRSRQSQFWKWPVDAFFEIDYNCINKAHVYKIIVINAISLISLVNWL